MSICLRAGAISVGWSAERLFRILAGLALTAVGCLDVFRFHLCRELAAALIGLSLPSTFALLYRLKVLEFRFTASGEMYLAHVVGYPSNSMTSSIGSRYLSRLLLASDPIWR